MAKGQSPPKLPLELQAAWRCRRCWRARSIPRQRLAGQSSGRQGSWDGMGGGHECHSALINLCPPAPGEAAGAAACAPLCPHYTSIY